VQLLHLDLGDLDAQIGTPIGLEGALRRVREDLQQLLEVALVAEQRHQVLGRGLMIGMDLERARQIARRRQAVLTLARRQGEQIRGALGALGDTSLVLRGLRQQIGVGAVAGEPPQAARGRDVVRILREGVPVSVERRHVSTVLERLGEPRLVCGHHRRVFAALSELRVDLRDEVPVLLGDGEPLERGQDLAVGRREAHDRQIGLGHLGAVHQAMCLLDTPQLAQRGDAPGGMREHLGLLRVDAGQLLVLTDARVDVLERQQGTDLIGVPLEDRLVDLRGLGGLLEVVEQYLRAPEQRVDGVPLALCRGRLARQIGR
jgi:hypothetical protein